MTDWIGGIGDRRVICMNTMKVYSCPEGAAYSLNFFNPDQKFQGVKSSDIVTNCNRFIKSIFNGMSFEWYNQYLKDTGSEDIQSKPERIKMKYPESKREFTLKNRQGPKRFYADVRKVYRAIKKTYMINPAIIGFTFSIPAFLSAIGIDRLSSASMSKHFKNHIDIYKTLFGMELSTTYSPKSSKDVLSIKLNKFTNIGINENPDNDWDIQRYFSKHHDEESSYMKGKKRVSVPVIRLEDSRVFGALHTAERLCGVERSKIVFCCEGDIPYCKKYASKYTFRYVDFVED
jgi:hypothetical protein